MLDIVLVDRNRRGWEWRLCDESGAVLGRGRERTRLAARYRVYQAMFLALANCGRIIDPGPLAP